MSEHAHTNRLARETSPYLLQHQHNPVDWYPWGPEAFERARAEDKPLLLSVGYSACHWCHVMERESFESDEIAGLMNQLFVNIKVDREERPDVDQIYMQAVQAMTGHGGWPMTVFLTPEGVPFYGGTYYPPVDRQGMPGFPRLIQSVAEAYRSRRGEIVEAGRQLLEQMRQGERLRSSATLLTDEILVG
ncbi:MAG TPA: thioredoxin domain-containing protein, partial [Methylomirabilota bacterium]|nr:thioredoxin domain-containing protein [Methylomirabilota bacterium]